MVVNLDQTNINEKEGNKNNKKIKKKKNIL